MVQADRPDAGPGHSIGVGECFPDTRFDTPAVVGAIFAVLVVLGKVMDGYMHRGGSARKHADLDYLLAYRRRYRFIMRFQALKIDFDGFLNILQSNSPRFALRDAARQGGHFRDKDTIFVLLKNHAVFHFGLITDSKVEIIITQKNKMGEGEAAVYAMYTTVATPP
jgi:hypothetical protein